MARKEQACRSFVNSVTLWMLFHSNGSKIAGRWMRSVGRVTRSYPRNYSFSIHRECVSLARPVMVARKLFHCTRVFHVLNY